ncbi:MAG: adenylyltransferase/cytidyltransferase family protein [Endomicrobium sp.]|jgi:D-beta-D-heptose 7-phosphate kinase/D-beta-D-heptose 1-phosphate adenosyltransferase|nr:adenylyltransferase/cytidyltransferase family protein [Endomicrobium sp.]
MKNLKDIKRVLTIKEMKQEVLNLQKEGKKVVFTNGCFDLLHLGHISLFNKAKSLGDILIVAINSDKSLSCLKGPKRPLVSQKDRAKLILSLKPVDYVVVFGEQTPSKILKELRPDILVKGGDYKLSEIVGREYVHKVYRFPFIKGKSTTNLINLIVDRYSGRAV